MNAASKDSKENRAWAKQRRGFKHQLLLALIDEGFSIREANSVIDAIFSSIKEALRRKERVETPIGAFEVVPDDRKVGYRFGRVVQFKRHRVVFEAAAEARTIKKAKSTQRKTRHIPDAPILNKLNHVCRNWEEWDDVVRGLNVDILYRLGLSYRAMADCLGYSEGMMRYLHRVGLLTDYWKGQIRAGASTRSVMKIVGFR